MGWREITPEYKIRRQEYHKRTPHRKISAKQLKSVRKIHRSVSKQKG